MKISLIPSSWQENSFISLSSYIPLKWQKKRSQPSAVLVDKGNGKRRMIKSHTAGRLLILYRWQKGILGGKKRTNFPSELPANPTLANHRRKNGGSGAGGPVTGEATSQHSWAADSSLTLRLSLGDSRDWVAGRGGSHTTTESRTGQQVSPRSLGSTGIGSQVKHNNLCYFWVNRHFGSQTGTITVFPWK